MDTDADWPIPDDEVERLAELLSLRISNEPELELNQIVEMASDLLDVPIALINLAHDDHIKVKAGTGLDVDTVPRDVAFCSHTILSPDPLVIPDLREDERFRHNVLVNGPLNARFYAGIPLRTQKGFNIGTLCVLDTEPHQALSAKQQRLLKRLADLVMNKFERGREQQAERSIKPSVEAASAAFICVDDEGVITRWNAAAETMFGCPSAEAIGKSIEIIMPERFRSAHRAGFGRVAGGGSSKLVGRPLELAAVRANGEEFPVELLISKLDHDGHHVMGAVMRDLTDGRRDANGLEYLARHDQLTGLLNRYYMCELLDLAIASGEQASILLMDVDGFKAVNENLGRDRGDTLLQAIAIRLEACLDPAMHVARMGDDDFAVLLNGGSSEAYALALAIQIAIAEPFDLFNQSVSLTVSVGISTIQSAGNSVRLLLASADMALFAAKAGGRQNCHVFQPRMRERFVRRKKLALELQAAAANSEFVMHYQPQVDLETGGLIGCEALLRWNHAELGLLYPRDFIDALEHADCSEDLGWWTLDAACRQLAEWDRRGLHVQCVGVNLFAKQLRSTDFVARVVETLAAYGLTPDRLELELTESLALRQGDSSLSTLVDVRAAGIRLALDDFGTGFASLSTLKRIPFTRLKIDKSFVDDLDGATRDAAVVRAVIGIARDLRVSVIAEGIESMRQAVNIRRLGCREAQGFLYGRGLPAAEFERQFSVGLTDVAWTIPSEEGRAGRLPRRALVTGLDIIP